MAEATHYDVDVEVRDSLRAIEKERTTRLAIAIASMIAILALVGFSLYYAFSSEPGAGAIPALER